MPSRKEVGKNGIALSPTVCWRAGATTAMQAAQKAVRHRRGLQRIAPFKVHVRQLSRRGAQPHTNDIRAEHQARPELSGAERRLTRRAPAHREALGLR